MAGKKIDVDYAVIGKHMKEIRRRMKLTQQEMAERFGVTTGYYASLETGQNQMSLHRFIQLITITQVSADFFLKGCNYALNEERCYEQDKSNERAELEALLDCSSDESVKAMLDVCLTLSKHIR